MNEHELMLTSVLKCRRIDLYVQDISLSVSQQKKFNEMKSRRDQGEPLQYVVGETEFCGLMFDVDERVLIPRPETEMMVEAVAQYLDVFKNKPLNVLEVGVGSGCVTVSLAKKFPQLTCDAIDISEEALCVAKKNIERHDVCDQVTLQHADAHDFLAQIFKPVYDMIISNPPYIPKAVMSELSKDVQQEPVLALEGGSDGLDFYRMFIKLAPQALKPGGILVCEFWDGQDGSLKDMFGQDWKVKFFKDLSGVNRFFIAQFCCNTETFQAEDVHAKTYC